MGLARRNCRFGRSCEAWPDAFFNCFKVRVVQAILGPVVWLSTKKGIFLSLYSLPTSMQATKRAPNRFPGATNILLAPPTTAWSHRHRHRPCLLLLTDVQDLILTAYLSLTLCLTSTHVHTMEETPKNSRAHATKEKIIACHENFLLGNTVATSFQFVTLTAAFH
jgi:hypothetical protein